MQIPQNLTEIFKTEKGAVYQSDTARCFWLEFKGQRNAYKINQLKHLMRRVKHINLAEMASNPHNAFDLEIIYSPTQGHCWVLTLCEIIQLRNLLEGTWAMLELNSIIQERIYATFA